MTKCRRENDGTMDRRENRHDHTTSMPHKHMKPPPKPLLNSLETLERARPRANYHTQVTTQEGENGGLQGPAHREHPSTSKGQEARVRRQEGSQPRAEESRKGQPHGGPTSGGGWPPPQAEDRPASRQGLGRGVRPCPQQSTSSTYLSEHQSNALLEQGRASAWQQ